MFVYFGQFDIGKPLIGLNYISEPTATAKNFGGEESLNAEQQKDLEIYLRTCAQQLEADPDFSGGLILCNLASVRSATFHLSRDIPNWRVCIATLPDWFVLVHSGECSAMRLWKLSEHEADLHSRRIHLFNLAGLVNLFAFWKRYGFRLIPQHVDTRTLNGFNLECDFAIQMRADVRQSHDTHCVRSHGNDQWVRLVRHNVRSLFAEDSEYKLYADWDAVRDGQLVGCIEANTLWWISVPPIKSNRAVKDLVFQLWDCALHWLARFVPIAEQRWGSVLPRSIQIDIQMPDVSNWRVNRRASDLIEAAELGTTPHPHNAQIRVSMPEGFLRHFNTPKNVAERRLVDALFAGMAALIGEGLNESQVSELTRCVIPNEDARYFHITNAQRLEQFFAQPGRPNPLFVQDEDLAIARIGLADLVGRPSDSDSIEGLANCREFLKDLVAKVWERIETRLKEFSRASVVTGCLRSLDEVARDEEQWDMTARSLFAMHSDAAEVHKVISNRRSERSKANVCNRLIVEVAQYSCCASPGGRLLSRSDHLALLADMTVLLQLAHHRDGIAFGFVDPRVKIFPNGEIEVDEKFYVEILNRYLTHRSEETTRRAADSYDERFSASSIDEGHITALSEKLNPVFIVEFGFKIDSLFTLLDSLRDAAVEIRASGGLINESDFRAILKHCSFSSAGCDSFLRRFVLPIRSAWNADLPEGSHTHDVYPWRFRRQLSLLTRPIVEVSKSPGLFFISVPLLGVSIAYWLSNIERAHFPKEFFRSPDMRRLVGQTSNKKGHDFAARVASVFDLLNHSSKLEIEMSTIGAPKHAGLGDIDVLAWNSFGYVYVVECKRLLTALTPREVIQRLEDFRGSREEKDSLGRHLRRIDWLRENPAAVAKLTMLPISKLRLVPLLVTSDIVPMQFFAEMKFPTNQVIAFDDLKGTISKR